MNHKIMCSWLIGRLTTGWRETEISGRLIGPFKLKQWHLHIWISVFIAEL